MRGYQKVCVGLTVLILFSLNGWALVYLNGSDWGFDELWESASVMDTSAQDRSISALVVEGAGHFLQSNSDFMLFLNRAEMSELNGVDFNELKATLDNAILNIENARDTYLLLKQKADGTPYNYGIIAELDSFNYEVFQREQDLVPSVFREVKAFLGDGQIRGVYGKILADTEEILAIANAIKASVDAEQFPELSTLWNLGHSCSRSLLFGQYVARVFYEVKKE